jgi:hypothetical protein
MRPGNDVGSALRVLIVEDEHLIRLNAVEALREEGFDVEEAWSGDEAALRLRGPQFFDVLFTDVLTPGEMEGIPCRDTRPDPLPPEGFRSRCCISPHALQDLGHRKQHPAFGRVAGAR